MIIGTTLSLLGEKKKNYSIHMDILLISQQEWPSQTLHVAHNVDDFFVGCVLMSEIMGLII